MQSKLYKHILTAALLVLSFTAWCQQNAYPRFLRGRVVSKDGQRPVEGAAVILKNEGKGTSSSPSGQFIIRITSPGEIMQVTCIGYKPADFRVDTISSDKEFRVALQPVSVEIAEVKVVATGYQTIPRERATGSFTQVDSGLLNQQTGTNILNRLASVAAGVSFDTKASGNAQRKLNFNIRGLSSINGPLDPLIVLDNFPYEGDINNINPNDVESITLLKDAAAASIWGARAGNGVVVIRTKKAKLNQKTVLSFHSALISSEKPDLFSLPVMAPADYIDVEEMLFGKGYYNNIIDFQPYSALSPAVQVFLNRKNELISGADSAAQISALKQTDSRDDYLRYFYQRPLTMQYSLGISGGTAKNAYSFSGSYDRNAGETYGTYNKANFRLSNLYNPVKGLNIDLGLYYTQSESRSGRPAYNSIKVGTRSVPYLDFADSEGNALAVETEYSRTYTDRISQGKLADWSYYPLEDYKHSASENSLHDLSAGLGLRYKLFPWLEAEIRYQYERQTSSNETIQDAESYAARNIVNTFSQIDPVTGNVKYIVPQGGVLSTTQSILQSHNTGSSTSGPISPSQGMSFPAASITTGNRGKTCMAPKRTIIPPGASLM